MKKQRCKKKEQGSALLVSLMVMVGLSLLGLGFVAVSETETAISVNERNSIEVLSRAETGARMAVEWFQNPKWAEEEGLMPPNDGTYPNVRTLRNPGTENYSYYKEPTLGGERFCDRPYKDRVIDRFWGDERRADLIINDTTAVDAGGVKFLDTLNTQLFGNEDGGRITDIRIYAPPIIGGVLTPRTGETVAANGGFYVGGVRYGLCTIKVTAQKRRGTQVVAERSVKIVLSEWPFPGPQGPVQSNASIDTGGNFGVHWGRITAMDTLEDSRATTSIPWHNAWDRLHFEHGFDSSIEWRTGMAVAVGDFVHPSKAAVTASTTAGGEIVLERFAYRVTTAGTTSAEPAWPTTLGDTVTEGAITYVTAHSFEYPRTHAPAEDGLYRYVPSPPGVSPQTLRQFNYLQEAIGKTFEDPWFEARARNLITVPAGISSPQLYTYSAPSDDEVGNEKALFENQNRDDIVTNLYKQVAFPRIDYDFWKDIAIQASATGEEGVKYLRWVDTDRYTDGLTTKQFAHWVNTVSPHNASSGYYFFDTRSGINPQNGNASQLTPEIKLNSADLGGAAGMQMQGFIYLNTELLNSTGLSGVLGYHGQPGEPFRDIGFRIVNAAGTGWDLDADGNYYFNEDLHVGNGQWDYQDVNGNSTFDVVLEAKTFTTTDGAATTTCTNCYVPKRWFPGCTIGTDCSEPHEPYLNMQYPDVETTVAGGASPPSIKVTWGTTASAHVARAKEKKANGSLPNCGSEPDFCTSVGYDRDGGFIKIAPIAVGVVYNEGSYTGTGNAVYYGSLLINGSVGKAGTADVYFDEALVKGNWQEQFEDFPRVLITAHETDQQ